MELDANVSITAGTARALANFRPGVIRVDEDGLAFAERGTTELVAIATGDIASVSISAHAFGADDVVVALASGGAWSIKVKGGARIVDALRGRGVVVKP
jgi:hypothetical protein